MTKTLDQNNPNSNGNNIIVITDEMHNRDVKRQRQRLELGIKRKTLLTAKLEIELEYFEGIILRFLEESKSTPFPELVEDLAIIKTRGGINSIWEFTKSDFGPFGRIGQVNVNWVNKQRCSIRIEVFPPCPQPDSIADEILPKYQRGLDVELLLYKASVQVLKRFGDYLQEELMSESRITETHVTLPVIHKEGKPGRPHWEEDIWAHKQVNDLGRSCSDVYKEWQQRINWEKRDLADPKRQFSRIIKPGWLPDKNDIIT